MADIVTIPTANSSSGTTYYDIHIRLPLRAFLVKKRYSEFEDLVGQLCDELGINPRDFPYGLPLKRINWFKSKGDAIVEERKLELAQFINLVVQDPSIQNSDTVREFLQLPINFKFSSNLFKPASDGKDFKLQIEEDAIDENNWLEILRALKATLGDNSAHNGSIGERIQTRDRISRTIHPTLEKLTKSLPGTRQKLSPTEYERRSGLLKEMEGQVGTLILSLERPNQEAFQQDSLRTSRRVFGAKETAETLPLDNRELLQQQVQIHKQQDQEVEQLRKLIQRQRQIGAAINTEVEEQNTILDHFNEEVGNATEKLQTARKKARGIL